MSNFLNSPEDAVDQMLEGFVAVNAGYVDRIAPRVLRSTDRTPGVAVVTLGGSGHKPAFIGYIGTALLDAVAVGDIFTSPPAATIFTAIMEADKGSGVICPIGNYSGDVMNAEMAVELALEQGVDVRLVIAKDDMGGGGAVPADLRRGVAGQAFVWKLCGALAAQGHGLDEIEEQANQLSSNMRSIGVALTSLVHPVSGKKTFQIADGEMEYGVGHHGEPGISREPVQSVTQIVNRFIDEILTELPLEQSDTVAVLINGLGATTQLELYVAYREVNLRLGRLGIKPAVSWVGEHFTALEMAGFSLTLAKLTETQLRALKHPANAASMKFMEAPRDN